MLLYNSITGTYQSDPEVELLGLDDQDRRSIVDRIWSDLILPLDESRVNGLTDRDIERFDKLIDAIRHWPSDKLFALAEEPVAFRKEVYL